MATSNTVLLMAGTGAKTQNLEYIFLDAEAVWNIYKITKGWVLNFCETMMKVTNAVSDFWNFYISQAHRSY